MKSMPLFVIGVCLGALGAWYLLHFDPNSPTAIDGDQSAVVLGGNDSDGQFRGDRDNDAADVLDAVTRQAQLLLLTTRAQIAPRDAFVEAQAIEDAGLRTSALVSIARSWSRTEPQQALAEAALLSDDDRVLVESVISREWAFIDPAALFAYAEAAGSIDQIVAGLNDLLATDPERVWAIADRHDVLANSVADELYLDAVRAMAGRDPAGTVSRFQGLAAGERRNPILASIAEGYAASDPEAALAWVLSLQPLSPDAASAVIEIIAIEDPLRAYDVVRQSAGQGLSIDSLRWMLATSVFEGRQDPASIATTLIERYDAEFSNPFVSSLLRNWVEQVPDDAMAWLTTNRTQVTGESVTTMVSGLAFENVHLAASLANRVPLEFQQEWLSQTANRLGQFDADTGVEWIAQFETRSDFDELINQMVMGAAAGNPQFAADLIENSDHNIDSDMASWTGNFFARSDPQSAADWALRLSDSEKSAAAIEGVATGWMLSDPAAAQQWAFDTPRGAARDTIINTLFDQGMRSPLDHESLIDGYSSSEVADRFIAQFAERVSQNRSFYGEAGMARVEQMISLMTDSDLRREAKGRIAEAR